MDNYVHIIRHSKDNQVSKNLNSYLDLKFNHFDIQCNLKRYINNSYKMNYILNINIEEFTLTSVI